MVRTGNAVTPLGICQVEFRVRRLVDSTPFYSDLLGLTAEQGSDTAGIVCSFVGAPDSSGGRFRVVLTEGLPSGTELAGLDHVGMCVPTEQDVRDTYARARALGFRATRPRSKGDCCQTYVFDPDGYKIEIRSLGVAV